MSLISGIYTIKDLLAKKNLSVPPYQRPYKWTEENVNQLIDDILENCGKKKSAYRLGTIVFHKDVVKEECGTEKEILNIVDGQQRTITITLLTNAMLEHVADKKDYKDFLFGSGETLDKYTPKYELRFQSDISQKNIVENYRLIRQRIAEFDKETVKFFFCKCQFVYVQLDDISEAFQFFDSQNSRGEDLKPHDLLKAFHLREMNEFSSEDEKKSVVKVWEQSKDHRLEELFALYLYRIKNWGRNYSAASFQKKDANVFKGVSPDVHEDYPYAESLRISNFYTDEYNASCYRKINRKEAEFPFQIDQPVVNGKRFFEMISHYETLRDRLFSLYDDGKPLSDSSTFGERVLKTVFVYEGADRKGDKAIRDMFFTALLYYVDRFGMFEIDKAIGVIFLWAYRLRLILHEIKPNSIDNYGMGYGHSIVPLFRKIREAVSPYEILNMRQRVIVASDIKDKSKPTKVEEIITLFRERKCYE